MRGTIIMWSGERGVVAAGGARYDFDINAWRGDSAPKADMSVEVEVEGGKLRSLLPAMQESLGQDAVQQLVGGAAEIAHAVLNNVGRRTAIAYGVFGIGALFLDFVSVGAMGGGVSYSLPDTISALSGGSSGGMLLVLLALATIVVPHFWKHKFAALTLCLPSIVALYGAFKYYRMSSAVSAQVEQMGALMGNNPFATSMMKQAVATSPYSLGIGAYAVLAAAAFIAYSSVTKYLAANRSGTNASA